jgi:hypothetical protein
MKKDRTSRAEITWLDALGIPKDKKHRQVRLQCFTRGFYVDGYMPPNTVYEFLGNYWHHSTKRRYLKTQEKFALLMAYGYNVVYIWESEWKQQEKK